MKILSLFSNVGVAEAALNSSQFPVVVANEIDSRRAELYKEIYPSTKMVIGDIRLDEIKMEISSLAKKEGVEIVIATPPCQGMSSAGQKKVNDERNNLILDVLQIIKELKPKYVFIENVIQFLVTKINYNGEDLEIKNIITKVLGDDYDISTNIVEMSEYGVPQTRQRVIILITRKDVLYKWELPPKAEVVTLKEALNGVPSVDPLITDISYEEMLELFPEYEEKLKNALLLSKWHKPPTHILRQVNSMRYTPTGKSAFDNEKYKPRKENGDIVRGYKNTYKRQEWDKPAYTVTMDNRKISSQNNVHPGVPLYVDENGDTVYSDPRSFTLYEIMQVMTIPSDWNIPDNVSEAFLRRIIGEGVPPLFVKKVFDSLEEKNE